ncbi:MAG: FKBP-type peptidyl-prolyl cis-trans isomerase [Phycisphaerales bacterium]|jgi:FKBP-type peptidyl-prolyl cis-trans isomerase|nr:FKBP-type peptidyl-prolyl cis-trans isomerase [Phycisphaerales bacterium]MBT7171684.1 FKBP-type peptidyl-prolyl cis-trans isomerase [Phycisphaerales bacterium]
MTAEKNLEQGQAFMQAKTDEGGYTATESGLLYRVLTASDSTESPKPIDVVTVHYRGTHIDGSEFDSSYSRNSSIQFPLNGVIAGWTEAVGMMSIGAKWEVIIPPALGYGEFGAGGVIGPNETLIFEIELLAIN